MSSTYSHPVDPRKLSLGVELGMHALGANPTRDGVQFGLVSRHARHVWISLFSNADDESPAVEFELRPESHKHGDLWSAKITGLSAGAIYCYRVDGPGGLTLGHRFDASRFLLDPYARALTGAPSKRPVKCVVADLPEAIPLDGWPLIKQQDLIIYETHVRGYTAHASSGAVSPGTFTGFIEKIPHLKELGISAVELLPVHACGEGVLKRKPIKSGRTLTNYWGYNPIAYFVPDPRFSAGTDPLDPIREFRALSTALHEAGIELIVDVVYNHTCETAAAAPMRSFQGIDNTLYYRLDGKGQYVDYTGCGNTFDTSHPVSRRLIIDSLRYWVTYLGVDGFRFDLATALMRDADGNVNRRAALLDDIARDPVLRHVRLIVEPWDLGPHGYQCGAFEGPEWREWNAPYRDDMRRYWRSDSHMTGAFARRLTGSHDLFEDHGRTPVHSINFVTAHDGFTLRDLVTYKQKRNEENGEDGKDGTDDNLSWNCGVEGETDDAVINALRLRMQKNYLAVLMLSLGTPMMLGGDEFGRTQGGNNNAYCQDNEVSWFDWNLAAENAELVRFCRETIRFRREHVVFRRERFFTGARPKPDGRPDVLWLDANGGDPDWQAGQPHLGFWINAAENRGVALCMLFNPTARAKTFQLPEGRWSIRINTAESSPGDILTPEKSLRMSTKTIVVEQHSLVVLTDASFR